MLSYFCSNCGSNNTESEVSPNRGTLFVGEETDCSEETFDGQVVHVICNDCEKSSYASLTD